MIGLARLRRAWNEFFFEPASPLPVCAFRVAYGLLVLVDILLLMPDAGTWFSEAGILPVAVQQRLQPMSRLDVMGALVQSEAGALVFLAALAAAATALTAGFKTRAAAVITFLGLTSLHHRNVFILHGGDTLLRVMGFFLIFSQAGARLSVDAWLARGRGRAAPARVEPWAQRLLQLQLCAMYVFTAVSKMSGTMWAEGTAVYFVLNLDEFRRFPVPIIPHYLPLVKLATWGTLAVEFAVGTLVWVRELRYVVLAAGLCLHLSIEWAMNVPLFQWTAIAGYLLFVRADDLEAALRRLRAPA
ncbi:MAG: HTTM domain-containing protein [Elusimicrobia bacterium]|nr:HTTM domain-containing protein [Elusimicrobiota bacterium]